MSLGRRQYEARTLFTLHAEHPSEVLLDWDEEAAQRALEQTQSAAERDPYASQYLAEQLLAQPAHLAVRQYNPIETYATLLLVAQLKPWEIDRMHFMHFFGLLREVLLATERKNAAYADAQAQTQTVDSYQ